MFLFTYISVYLSIYQSICVVYQFIHIFMLFINLFIYLCYSSVNSFIYVIYQFNRLSMLSTHSSMYLCVHSFIYFLNYLSICQFSSLIRLLKDRNNTQFDSSHRGFRRSTQWTIILRVRPKIIFSGPWRGKCWTTEAIWKDDGRVGASPGRWAGPEMVSTSRHSETWIGIWGSVPN